VLPELTIYLGAVVTWLNRLRLFRIYLLSTTLIKFDRFAWLLILDCLVLILESTTVAIQQSLRWLLHLVQVDARVANLHNFVQVRQSLVLVHLSHS